VPPQKGKARALVKREIHPSRKSAPAWHRPHSAPSSPPCGSVWQEAQAIDGRVDGDVWHAAHATPEWDTPRGIACGRGRRRPASTRRWRGTRRRMRCRSGRPLRADRRGIPHMPSAGAVEARPATGEDLDRPVARFALHLDVRAGQREAAARMIESSGRPEGVVAMAAGAVCLRVHLELPEVHVGVTVGADHRCEAICRNRRRSRRVLAQPCDARPPSARLAAERAVAIHAGDLRVPAAQRERRVLRMVETQIVE